MQGPGSPSEDLPLSEVLQPGPERRKETAGPRPSLHSDTRSPGVQPPGIPPLSVG